MNITEQLRQAADCAPLWRSIFEAAADEIERLQNENGLLIRVQDIFDNEEEVDHALSNKELNKIKSDAVREAITHAAKTDDHHRTSYEAYRIMTEYAIKLERVEI